MAEIASAFVTLMPSARDFGSRTEKEIAPGLSSAGKKSGSRFGKVFATASMSPIRAIGTAALGLFAFDKAKDFLKDSVGAASDLQETGTKIDAIFGDAASQVQAFAGKGAKALGQTKLQILDAASTFGTFGKAAGLTGRDLAKFSTGFSGLSTDLASFFNTSPEQAAEAIGSALRGEAEPMRQFGVLLDDSTLKAEALSLGILKPVKDEAKIKAYYARVTVAQAAYNDAVAAHGKKSIEAIKAQASLGTAQSSLAKATEGTIPTLTQQQKVLAAQSAIYKQTKTAQGDFKRTSGGLANQQRILSATFGDLKATIGTALLPVITKFAQYLNTNVMPAITGFIGQMKSGQGVGGQFADVAKAIGSALADTAGFIKRNSDVLVPLIGAVLSGIAAFKVITAVVKAYTAIQLALNFAMTANPIGIVIVAIAALAAGLVLAYKKSATFRKIVQAAFAGVQAAASAVAGFFTKQVPAAFDKVTGAGKAVFGWVKSNWPLILGILTGPFGLAVVLIAKNWDKIVAGGQRVMDFIKSLPGRITSALSGFGSLLVHAGQELMDGLISGITSKIDSIRDKMAEVAGAIKGFLPGSPVKHGPLRSWNNGGAGKRLMGFLAAGIKSGKTGVIKEMAGVGKALEREIDKLAARYKRAADNLAQRISAKNSMASGIADSLKGALDLGSLISEPNEFGFGGGTVSFMSVSKTVFALATKAKRFAGLLGRLLKSGIPKGLVQEVAGLGIEQGSAVARALLTGSKSQVKTLAQNYASFNAYSNIAGNVVADAFYGAGIKAQRNLVKGILTGPGIKNLAAQLAHALNVATAAAAKGNVKGVGKQNAPRGARSLANRAEAASDLASQLSRIQIHVKVGADDRTKAQFYIDGKRVAERLA